MKNTQKIQTLAALIPSLLSEGATDVKLYVEFEDSAPVLSFHYTDVWEGGEQDLAVKVTLEIRRGLRYRVESNYVDSSDGVGEPAVWTVRTPGEILTCLEGGRP